ncbi:hypothetical protein [Metasolibacillus sp.]|nr:hypothetical protein [Metasolibacillus sp.]MCT6925067.1 hypothetical protein [Metasolibacillus sp.]MCT6941240.1 hypothetical protein [Metasolibacillus sp.]
MKGHDEQLRQAMEAYGDYLAIPVSMQESDGHFTFHYYDQQGNLLE